MGQRALARRVICARALLILRLTHRVSRGTGCGDQQSVDDARAFVLAGHTIT
ncbi:predicted protein [Streptomyces viridosporus ATCC 14672]|uniref:Predicted protein n=1 Tax=Streptomyces viridosporus (strain ATCC 14672 / DSM 40746 / JCM 4963 / KCTC 9882 / NRRL B-12104 / FH 1290) TaxID=566461 RepID=D5ZNX1_STRV1|nr:predicted protein [Streptomyces viridosporus ATCC 14672]